MTNETEMNTHCRYLNAVEKGWDAEFVTSILQGICLKYYWTSILQGICLKYYCCKETFARFLYIFLKLFLWTRWRKSVDNCGKWVLNSFKLSSLTVISLLKTNEIIAKFYSRLHGEWQVCATQITPVKFRENASPVFGCSPSWCLSLFMGLPERFIQHFHIDHNAPCVPRPPPPPKKNFAIVFELSLDDCNTQEQPTFGDATTSFPVKWRPRNERRNSILMTCHYPDLGSAFDKLKNCFTQSEALTRSG